MKTRCLQRKALLLPAYRRQIARCAAAVRYDLSELTPAAHDFVEKLAASGLAGSTVKSVYRLLAASLRFAQEEGQIAQNPCRKIKIQGVQISEQRVLSRREQDRIRTLPSRKELSALLGHRHASGRGLRAPVVGH